MDIGIIFWFATTLPRAGHTNFVFQSGYAGCNLMLKLPPNICLKFLPITAGADGARVSLVSGGTSFRPLCFSLLKSASSTSEFSRSDMGQIF